MREALRQAKKAYEADEVPVGAVVVRAGRIIGRAHNQIELLKDATAHAEMLALTQAEAAVGDWRLLDCDLYVTKEPCPMCAGALVHVRMRRVVQRTGPRSSGNGRRSRGTSPHELHVDSGQLPWCFGRRSPSSRKGGSCLPPLLLPRAAAVSSVSPKPYREGNVRLPDGGAQ